MLLYIYYTVIYLLISSALRIINYLSKKNIIYYNNGNWILYFMLKPILQLLANETIAAKIMIINYQNNDERRYSKASVLTLQDCIT